MLVVKKILVPVDFDETSLGIVQLAAGLARRFDADVLLAHVVTPRGYAPPAETPGSGGQSGALLANVDRFEEKDLHESVRKELQGLRLKCLVRKGNAADEIVEMARQEAADLIVMPTHGNDGFYRYLIGSVTAKVIHESDCPVLTGAHLREGPAGPLDVKHVLCGVTYSEHTQVALKWAAKLAEEFKAKLTLGHVTPSLEMYGPGGMYVNHRWGDELIAGAKELLAKLQKESGVTGDTSIESGDPAQGMARIVSRVGADLLVIGGHTSGGRLGSYGYAIISEAGIPVLSV